MPGLLKALEEDPEITVRVSVAEALGQLGSEAAIPGLLKALEEDPEITVRASVAYALLGHLHALLGHLQLSDQFGSQDEDMGAMILKLLKLSQLALEENPKSLFLRT
ncbi:MAG: HEAT repeat domain-containing protein [Cyanobacteria bacterium CRU_2_1]|nr:HEAT repeat domain-containing protein [Cyanobacteria bacterium CRU_2_1]